ncbi:MAG: hypothetical protein WC834_07575 [Eubacteriales bacterium]
MLKHMRKFICFFLALFLLVPSWVGAAPSGQTLNTIDLQVLGGGAGLAPSGKHVSVSIGSEDIKFSTVYLYSGSTPSFTVGVPETLKDMASGLNSELKLRHTRLSVSDKYIAPTTEVKTIKINGKDVKGNWLVWRIPAQTGSGLEVNFTYTVEKIPFSENFQIGYLPSVDQKQTTSKISFSFGSYTPAGLVEVQPKGYDLTGNSVRWEATGDNTDSNGKAINYSITLNNAFNKAYPKYFKGQDQSTLTEVLKLSRDRKYKEALNKIEPLTKKTDLSPQQKELLSFYKAEIDLGLYKYPEVLNDLSTVDPNNLQISENKEVFAGFYYYFLVQTYKEQGKFKELQDIAGQGKKARLNLPMQEWLKVTAQRMKNVEDIMAGKSPSNPVYGTGKGSKVLALIAVIIVAAAGGFWLYQKRKK